jgi:hypothetical protein
MQEGTTLRVMAAERPYGEFYDIYSIIPEYLGYHHLNSWMNGTKVEVERLSVWCFGVLGEGGSVEENK